jgi:hypothetical protein
MSQAQSWLLLGGLTNLLVSVIVAYGLYWIRLRRPDVPAQRYAMVAHKLILWNGFLLLGLAVVIDQTGFSARVNTGLAIAEVAVTVLAGGRTIMSWAQNIPDEIAAGGWRARMIGLVNMVHLIVVAGILYGFSRTVLGI